MLIKGDQEEETKEDDESWMFKTFSKSKPKQKEKPKEKEQDMMDLDPFGEIPGMKKLDNQDLSDPFLQGNI